MRTSPCCPLRGLILAVLPLRLSYDLGSDATQALRTQSTDTSIEIGSSLPRVRSFQRPFPGRDYDGQPLTLCHDFSGSRSPVASCSARPLIVGYPALLSVVSQLLSVCVPSGLHGRERPCIKHAVPHERCGLSALIVGLHRACGIFEGSPPAGNVQERYSFPFNICSLDTLPGEWVVLWAVVGHSPKGEEKEGAWGSHSLMLHCRISSTGNSSKRRNFQIFL